MKLSNFTSQHKNWLENRERGNQIDLKAITLDAERISNAVCESAIFEQVTLVSLELFSCNFVGSRFFDCIFLNCQFVGSNFHKAEFHNCQFELAKISECGFTKTEWYRGKLQEARFADCDFSWSYLQSVDLRNAHLTGINLEGALWDHVKVHGSRYESISFGKQHPARIQRIDISPDGDGSTEVELQRFREIFEV